MEVLSSSEEDAASMDQDFSEQVCNCWVGAIL